MKDNSVSSNGFPGSPAGSVPVVTNSTPPPATETVPRPSPRQRLLAALTGLLPRNLPASNPPSGRTNSSSSYKGASRALGVTALLAVLAVGLLFLLPGGPLHAQEAAIQYPENGTGPVATYTAVDPEMTDIVSWSLGGDDAGDFMIDNGVLRFAKSPNYEMATGGGPGGEASDNMYMVTVKAMDSTGKTGEEMVTVEVTNVDEPGTVALSALQPQAGTALTAMDSDPDGDISDIKWQWAKSMTMDGTYEDIDKAISSAYTPKDAGHRLLPTSDGQLHRSRG